MSQYLIETSSIINYFREDPVTVSIINKISEDISSSYICLSELYEGVYRVKNKEKAEEGLLTFFKGMTQIYGIDYEIAKVFGQTRSYIREKGIVIEDLDLLIAATCIAKNLIMITNNKKHFKRIPGLQIL